jgi:excinuclease UvrABC helicase subunit UvrB
VLVTTLTKRAEISRSITQNSASGALLHSEIETGPNRKSCVRARRDFDALIGINLLWRDWIS